MSREDFLSSLASRIADERVLAAVAEVPRELFISPSLEQFAYLDRPLPIGGGQTISQPTLVARMCELLELAPDDVVLDVGSGSGYHAALLSRLCRHVYGIELDAELAAQASRTLALAGIDNATIVQGDGARGLPAPRPVRCDQRRRDGRPARCRPRSSSSSRRAGGSSPRSRMAATSASSSCAAAPTGRSSTRCSTRCASCRCANSTRRAGDRSRRVRRAPRRRRRPDRR